MYREQEDEAKRWHVGTVSNILHNQAYIGNLVQGRRRARHYKGEERHHTEKDEWIIIEDTHEPIVSKEVFDAVEEILAEKVKESVFASERTEGGPGSAESIQGYYVLRNLRTETRLQLRRFQGEAHWNAGTISPVINTTI